MISTKDLVQKHYRINKSQNLIQLRVEGDKIKLTKECVHIIDRVSKWSSGLIRRRVEDLAETGNSTEGWLHGEESRAMGWIIDGTSSIGSQRSQGLIRFCDDGTASGGTSSEVILINRVLDHLATHSVHSKGSHTHLVHVSHTDDDGTSVSESLDSGGVDWGDESIEDH